MLNIRTAPTTSVQISEDISLTVLVSSMVATNQNLPSDKKACHKIAKMYSDLSAGIHKSTSSMDTPVWEISQWLLRNNVVGRDGERVATHDKTNLKRLLMTWRLVATAYWSELSGGCHRQKVSQAVCCI